MLTRRCLFVFWAGLLALAAMPSYAVAQSFGPRGGLDLTKLAASGGYGASGASERGGLVGGFLAWDFLGRFGVETDPGVTWQRVRIEDVVRDQLVYFDLPALARVRVLGHKGGRTVHGVGGAVYHRLLTATETIAGQSYDAKAGVQGTGVSVAVGADVEFWSRWIAGFRYVRGYSAVYNTVGQPGGKHRTVQVTVAYRLR